jgi:branched-chain amino acid transport system substrate-binding protein
MFKNKGSRTTLTAAVALLALLFQMTPAPAHAKGDALAATSSSVVKIGFLAPLSGIGAAVGKRMEGTAELYLDLIDHRIAGRKIELIVANDESNPATGMQKVRELADKDKVNVVGGGYFAHVVYAIAPLAAQFKVPLVVDVSAADDITKRKRSPWVLRSGWSSSGAMLPFGPYVRKELGYKRVVTLSMDYPYGYEVVGDFQKSFEDAGGQVIQKLWAPLGFSDFSGIVKQIRPDADALFLCTIGPATETIPRQLKEAGNKLPLIGIGTSFDEVYFPKAGEAMAGGVSALPYSVMVDTPANQNFLKAYRTKFGNDPSWEAMLTWTQMMFLQKAIETAKDDVSNPEKFLAVLRKTELADSPHGPMKLDSFGNPIENIYIRKVTTENGKLQNTIIATLKMVSQFGKYSPEAFMALPPWTKDIPPCKFCSTK